jgi:hypothetical protein
MTEGRPCACRMTEGRPCACRNVEGRPTEELWLAGLELLGAEAPRNRALYGRGRCRHNGLVSEPLPGAREPGLPYRARLPVTLRALRLAAYAFGAASIFWFFFSSIGVLVGVLYFVFMRDPRWRLHGIVLAVAAATSEFVAHVGTALEPLHLAMRTGPVILGAYLVVWAAIGLPARVRSRRRLLPGEGRDRAVGRWLRFRRQTGGRRGLLQADGRRRFAVVPGPAGAVLSMVIALVPVGLWSSVSVHFGVLFDNAPRMLWVHAPSTLVPGEPFSFTVQGWDAYERLSAVYHGTVRFSVESYDGGGGGPVAEADASLPGAYTFTGQKRGSGIAYRIADGRDNGRREFRARIHAPGIHYLVVTDSVTGNRYYSNPVEVREAVEEGERIYWGDIHSHSALSDGTGSPAHAFFYAREVAGLDFYGLTDHGEILILIPGGFARLERETDRAYEPGSFVTFPGVEWTDVKTGHYTCIFDGDRLPANPRLSYLTVPTPGELWGVLDAFTETAGCRALALPHHSTQNSYLQDWTYVNPKYVKLAEVTSVHGEFLFEQRHPLNYRGAIDPPPEYVHGSSIADALRMGVRVCLYAAGDSHDGHPGHSLSHTPATVGHQRPVTKWHPRIGHPYPGGLTAVRASELTREAVFSALEEGRVYGSSDHGRPLLRFSLHAVMTAAGIPAGGSAAAGVGETRSGPPSPAGTAETGGSAQPPYGSTVRVETAGVPRRISVFLAQDGSPAGARGAPAPTAVAPGWLPDWEATVELIRNGELLAAMPVAAPVARVEYVDEEPISGASYPRESCLEREGRWYINRYSDHPVDPEALNAGGADFYLVRVVGRNGRCAYAGPIWVEAAAASSEGE